MREIPWGEADYFDLYGTTLVKPRERQPNLQEATVANFVRELDEELQEVFYLRYGERLSLRAIARRLGFKSHWPIQVRLAILHELAEEYINEHIELP